MQLAAGAGASPSASRVSAPAPQVRGLVDNATGDRLYGWAFDAARPGQRLVVELRLGGERLARTTADLARPDLAQNGIGDGCHAFEFALTPEEMAHLGEFAVVALAATGQEVALPLRLHQQPQAAMPAPPAGQAQLLESRRMRELVGGLAQRLASLPEAGAMQALAGQQVALAEQLRQGMQALEQRLAALPDGELVRQLALQQGLLAERLQALEVWMDRLDRRLAETPPAPPAPPAPPRLEPWQRALFAALGLALTAAVATGLWLKGS